MPIYPVYIPSKGRARGVDAPTFRVLARDNVPFYAVVEPQEEEAYVELVGRERVLVLPFRDLGLGSIPARNWIKDHATSEGHARHWQLDDNINVFRRMYKGVRIPCSSAIALRACELLTDRYENVAVSGLNYQMFVTLDTPAHFYQNVHVYSCTLVSNAIPNRWRGRYNEDTDLCLQVLADGWCTLLVNVFMADKRATMITPGGNMTELYQGNEESAGSGRLRMARDLERAWPGVVHVDRRWQRPAHVVHSSWRKFDTPLKLRPDFDRDALPMKDEYGMMLNQLQEIKSPRIQKILETWQAEHPTEASQAA